jgi:hypothetical protein
MDIGRGGPGGENFTAGATTNHGLAWTTNFARTSFKQICNSGIDVSNTDAIYTRDVAELMPSLCGLRKPKQMISKASVSTAQQIEVGGIGLILTWLTIEIVKLILHSWFVPRR